MSEKPKIGPAPDFNRLIFWISAVLALMLPVLLPNFRMLIPGAAFLGGVLFALVFGNPYLPITTRWTHRLLGIALVALGAGMDLRILGTVGAFGALASGIGLAAALILGWGLWRLFHGSPDSRWLLMLGVGLGGGTAIAAAVPAVRARSRDAATALGTVFLLNGLALTVFPLFGHLLKMDSGTFGWWAALCIPEAGGVAGAAAAFGTGAALDTAVAVKLARALWIFPAAWLAGGIIGVRNRHRAEGEIAHLHFRFPWFVPGVIAISAVFTFLPGWREFGGGALNTLAGNLISVTLFLIGANLNFQRLREIRFQNFAAAAAVWLLLTAMWAAVLSAWPPGWHF